MATENAKSQDIADSLDRMIENLGILAAKSVKNKRLGVADASEFLSTMTYLADVAASFAEFTPERRKRVKEIMKQSPCDYCPVIDGPEDSERAKGLNFRFLTLEIIKARVKIETLV